MPKQVFIHCIYCGNKKFRLLARTSTVEDSAILTEPELDRFIKGLHKETFRVGQIVVTARQVVFSQVREYLELVLHDYRQMLAKGKDPDRIKFDDEGTGKV